MGLVLQFGRLDGDRGERCGVGKEGRMGDGWLRDLKVVYGEMVIFSRKVIA